MITNEESKLIFPSDLFWLFYNEYLGNDLMYEYSLNLKHGGLSAPPRNLEFELVGHNSILRPT